MNTDRWLHCSIQLDIDYETNVSHIGSFSQGVCGGIQRREYLDLGGGHAEVYYLPLMIRKTNPETGEKEDSIDFANRCKERVKTQI